MGAYEKRASREVGPVSKVRSSGQTRSFWPVGMGECENRISLFLGPVSKVRSLGQTRSFWPIAIGEYKKWASR